MSRNPFSRVLRYGALLALLGAVGVQPAAARPKPGVTGPRQGFDLFASVFGLINANNWYCGISNRGNDCVDPTGSPVIGGGFWPKGTPDQYIFNAGLQVAGVIPGDAGFSWANDTVGAYFMDPRGDQAQGDGVSLVYSSIDPADAANWPDQAVVRDTAVYNAVLIGRNTISQQDTWVRYWDGNPTLLSGRKHPMGILVDQRSLAWTDVAKQNIVFFIYTFYNITATDPSAYSGIDPALRDSIIAVANRFHAGVKDKLGVDIPTAGYAFDSLYAAFFSDEDVGDAGHNYSTAILPFNLMMAYKSDFLEPNWTFPPTIFGAPFRPSPGFVGFKYLRSPVDPATGKQVGLTLFSNTLNSAVGFPDPVGVVQLWRYLSGHINPGAGDNPCTSPDPIQSHICYQAETAVDTRSYQASGPFILQPGQSATIVVALIGAPPVAKPLNDLGSSGIGGDVPPGFPPTGAQIAAGTSPARVIDSIAGWQSATDANGDGVIEQNEVKVVPGSLLGQAILAQAVFDNKFLLPFAPEAPNFFLVPGNSQVTIVWSPSASEATGDPYYTVASDPTSPLYDPNYRDHDVEGYRIYRGRTTGDLQLVAQFDYSNTTFLDYTAAFDYGGHCAPELGVTSGCPTSDFAANPQSHDIISPFVQILPGTGRTLLADSSVFVLKADTAVTSLGFPPLTDNGVPFAYVDKSVRNSFTYYYAVTAFDINSPKAGASSYESARVTKSVTPRAAGPDVTQTTLQKLVTGDDGVALNTSADWPSIDADNGTFSGNVPPATSGSFGFLAVVNEVLPNGDIKIQLDSVGPGYVGGVGPGPTLYTTLSGGGTTIQKSVELPEASFSSDATNDFSISAPLVPYDSARAKLFGIAFKQDVRMPVEFTGKVASYINNSNGVAVTNGRYGAGSPAYDASRYLAHSRWFDAGGSAPPDPTINALPDTTHNSGTLTNVGRIWNPMVYRDNNIPVLFRYYTYSGVAWYPADFIVTWDGNGGITVRDTTHHVDLPFNIHGGAGWGFVNEDSLLAAGYTQADFDGTNPTLWDGEGTPNVNVPGYEHLYATSPTCDLWGTPCMNYSPTAQLEPLDFNNDGVQDATGIILEINQEAFFMEMSSLPSAGTQWHLRAISGPMTADCTPGLQTTMTDCSNYHFTPPPAVTPNVPGLQYKISVTQQFSVDPTAKVNLDSVHTVPDPYYATNALEATATTKVLKFVHLPSEAIIRIYSVSGVLVQVLYHNDQTGGGEETWNLRNRNNQFVASGVYFYHVETPSGQEKVGRFTVINYAQ